MDDSSVVVLGLGRMGTAMADRFEEAGRSVVGWGRSVRRPAPGAPDGFGSAGDAVRGGGPVVLALFDGPACLAVLDQVQGLLEQGRLVVGTSTVSPDEAERLAAAVSATGARYVHAPVLGSVPAVRSGALRVLAGGAGTDVAAAAEVLAPVAAEVWHVGDARAAASLKLVANGSLAGALLALREALTAAAELDVPLGEALDVLALGRLGELVRGSRKRWEAPGDGPAFFTAAALRKDAALLAAASGVSGPEAALSSLLDAGDVRDDDDAAVLALPAAYRTEVPVL